MTMKNGRDIMVSQKQVIKKIHELTDNNVYYADAIEITSFFFNLRPIDVETVYYNYNLLNRCKKKKLVH